MSNSPGDDVSHVGCAHRLIVRVGSLLREREGDAVVQLTRLLVQTPEGSGSEVSMWTFVSSTRRPAMWGAGR